MRRIGLSDLEPAGHEVADFVWEQSCDWQARFLYGFLRIKDGPRFSVHMQAKYVSDQLLNLTDNEELLTLAGIMETLSSAMRVAAARKEQTYDLGQRVVGK